MKVGDILDRIQVRIDQGQAALPSLPEIAVKIRAELRDPDCSVDRLCRLLQCDPASAAYLLQAANSPLCRALMPIRDLHGAIARLGLPATAHLVTAHALRQIYVARSPSLRSRLNDCWRQGVRLAATSAVLAGRCPGFDPERALLAGLFQDIGVIPLLSEMYVLQLLKHDRLVEEVLDRCAGLVGARLLRHWQFETDLIEVARCREVWQRDGGPQTDLADLVLIARWHCHVGTPRMRACPRLPEIPAYAKLPLGDLTPESSLQILRDAAGEICAIQRMFGR